MSAGAGRNSGGAPEQPGAGGAEAGGRSGGVGGESAAGGGAEAGAGRLANVAGALLLGGASSRMGRNKAQLLLDGESLAARSAQLLARCFQEVLLVGGQPDADFCAPPARLVADPPGPRCPLRGLVGALAAAQAPRVVVIATDLPGLCDDLPLALSAWPDADAVIPRRGGRPEPLCALWRRDAVLPLARARLAAAAAAAAGDSAGAPGGADAPGVAAGAGRALSLRALIEALGNVRWLEGPELAALDPGGRALFNVNTPADWADWRARHSSAAREGRGAGGEGGAAFTAGGRSGGAAQ